MSFDSAMEALDAFEVPADGPRLASTVAAHDRFTARMTIAVGAYDVSGAWDAAGHTSAVAWLRDQGYTNADAVEMVSTASKLRRLPVTAQAWLDGRLRGGQIKVILAKVIERHLNLFAEHEAELVPYLATLDMLGTRTAMRVWRDRADALDQGRPRRDEPDTAFLSSTLDDRGHLSASLGPEGLALALEAMRIADSGDLDTPAPERRGQALVDIFRWFLDNQTVKHPGRYRPHVSVLMNSATWGSRSPEGYFVSTGMTVPPETLSRILCDCELDRVMLADGVILDHGRTVKEPPPDLFRAVVLRDQHCRWKTCNRPADWCHAHHNRWWHRHHGETCLENLVLLCARHHGMLHRDGWTSLLESDGTFHVTDPRGNTWTTHAPLIHGRPPPGSPPPNHDREFDDLEYLDEWALHLESRANENLIRDIRRAHARQLAGV